VIFVDSNIPMYLVGASHPNKDAARSLVEASVEAGEQLVTDAAVFQEILHRYAAINRRDAIAAAFEVLLGIVDTTFAIDLDLVHRARTLLDATPRVSARDAVHVAVMQREGIGTVMSFDRAFDNLPGIRRLG